MRFYIFIIITFLAIACNNFATQDAKPSQADSLEKLVLEGHDIAMPKIKKLERLQKQTSAAIDSLNKLSASAAKNNLAYKAKLDTTLQSLNNANFAMNKWMEEFEYDSLRNNEPQRIQYLQSELQKVNKMKDAVLSSIALADSVLRH